MSQAGGESGYIGSSTRDSLGAQARTLSTIAAHPAFLALLQEIQYTPESERMAAAERLSNIDTLRARGIELPEDGFRLTTRYFEDPNALVSGSIRTGTTGPEIGVARAAPSITTCFSVGFFACLSVGSTEVGTVSESPR